MKISVSETIDAPPADVFKFVSNPVLMSKAFPESVKKMEVLSENDQGVGSRFRETRLLRGREDVIEIETVEYVENEKVLSVAETGGSLWYTGFAVAPVAAGTLLTVSMEAQAKNLFVRIANFCMKPWLKKGGAEEVQAIKDHFSRGKVAGGGAE
jgi:carbon monoxide dehydrogenase subunit G